MDAWRSVAAVGLRATFLAAVLTAAFAGPVRADDFQAKLGYCKDCHGPSAQGYRGYLPIPRLAGQQPEYLENQLRAFIEHRRTNNIMFNVAHALKPGMVRALAESFHKLNPPPIGGGPRVLVAAGKNIFENGVPDANIAACAACHGPDATGRGEIPRLAGQLYPLSYQGADELGQGARAKSRATGHVGDHESGCAQLEQVADRGRRGVRQ